MKGESELRAGLRLIFFPSPMPLPEHPDVKVVLDKAEAFVHQQLEAKVAEARQNAQDIP